MPTIIVSAQGETGARSHPCGAKTTIGRQEGNAICLPAGGVSRRHAEVVAAGADYFLVDLGSDNGTWLSGVKLRPNERYLLRDDDWITIDIYRLRFSRLEDRIEQSFNDITDSEIMEVKLLKKVLRALDKETLASLEVLNGTAEGKKIFFADDTDTIVVGRDPSVDLPIEEYVVSRRHAKFVRRPDGILVQDLGSKNGTSVNMTRVTEAMVHDGDRVAFGTIVCIFRNPREVNLAAVGERITARRRAEAIPPPPRRAMTPTPTAPAPAADSDLALEEAEGPEPTAAEMGEMAPPEELAARERAHAYPTPHARATRWRFSPFEMGLFWLGTMVFLTTVVLLVRLLS